MGIKIEDLTLREIKIIKEAIKKGLCPRADDFEMCTEDDIESWGYKDCFFDCVEYAKLFNEETFIDILEYKPKYFSGELEELTINRIKILKLSDELFEKYELYDWEFIFDRVTIPEALGICFVDLKQISIRDYGRIGNFDMKQLMLHEIAHALECERYGTVGHGKVWKNICKEIGCSHWKWEQYKYNEIIRKEINIFTKLFNLIKQK